MRETRHRSAVRTEPEAGRPGPFRTSHIAGQKIALYDTGVSQAVFILRLNGEMRELGENEVQYHAELGELLEGIDGVILVGEIWREAFPGNEDYIFVKDWREALQAVRKIESARQIQGVLVKGSHSIGLENVVRELTA